MGEAPFQRESKRTEEKERKGAFIKMAFGIVDSIIVCLPDRREQRSSVGIADGRVFRYPRRELGAAHVSRVRPGRAVEQGRDGRRRHGRGRHHRRVRRRRRRRR